jgi:SAM-dependent methyltransferase
MYFNWNEDTVRWYIDAEKHTGFYKKLAVDIKPLIEGYKTLCDLGCGAALFDFALAPYIESIDCVDINETALASVEARAKQFGQHNIRTRLADSDTLAGHWDVVFMSFFGSRELDRYLPLCKKLIAVVASESDTELFPRRERNVSRNTVENTIEYLDGKGICYKLIKTRYEFGQPFTSREDADLFIQTYAPYTSTEEASAFLDERLVVTGNQEFPYYIPRFKSVGIFELRGDGL